jgi:hypothetical protein
MNIETKIKTYLTAKLGIPVHTQTPKSVEVEYVVFQITERERVDYIDGVTVEFLSYAETMVDASALDEALRDAMFSFIEEPEISSSKIAGGDYEYDTALKKHAYRSYFNIFY